MPSNSSKYSFKDRQELYNDLIGLSYEDNKIIVTILIYTNEPFTENSNGIFFDVEHAKDETIELLIRYFN